MHYTEVLSAPYVPTTASREDRAKHQGGSARSGPCHSQNAAKTRAIPDFDTVTRLDVIDTR
jgi:hypothetical protein